MSRPCVCGGSNENCRYCNGLGTIRDNLADALISHAQHPIAHGYPSRSGIGRSRPKLELVPCPVPGCIVRLKASRVEKHVLKVHSALRSPTSKESPIQGAERVQPGVMTAHQLVQCPITGCGVKLNPNRVERHLRRAHRGGIKPEITETESRFAGTILRIRDVKRAKRTVRKPPKYVVVKPVSQSHSKVSSYGQAPEKNLDATKGYAHAYRENGRFGSHPSHDGYDGESGPD